MVPLIQDLAVKQKGWCNEDEILEYITIAQSLPGMFGANVATNVGYKVGGLLGSISAVAGMVTPSLVIITLFASIYDTIMQYEIVQNIFSGMKSAVLALIIVTSINLFKKAVKQRIQVAIFTLAIIASLFLGISPFYLIISGLIFGPIYSILLTYNRKEKK